ncbi:MAG: hypothetical protein AAFV47_07380 [Pseudomonadota bacterium]
MMTNRRGSFLTAFAAVAALGLAPIAQAHGDLDEEKLEEFQLHLDDYEQDVIAMIATVVDIVDNANATKSDTDALIQQWEDVAVHEAIEFKATLAYPGVWQGLIQLQTAVESAGDKDAAGEALKAALWQGMGALRMAATMVDLINDEISDEAPLSGPESVDAIISALTRAVELYEAGDTAAAEKAIFDSYEDRFEYLEGDLIPKDPELVTSLEADFNATLPLGMKAGASGEQMREILAAMTSKLESAKAILEAVEAERGAVF